MPASRALQTTAAALVFATLAGQAHADEPTWEDRLDRLERRLGVVREANQIPGLAFVLVKDGQVELAANLGFSDLASGTPVTSDTVFPVGPVTETFSATLAAMAAADRRVYLDKPAGRLFTDFTLADRDAARRFSIGDLLSHQTGVGPLDMLTAGAASRDDIFAAASRAQPVAEFRSTFIENPVTFTAGMAAVEFSLDQTWAEAVRDRIAQPLSLESALFDTSAMSGSESGAVGYVWDDKAQEFVAQPTPAAGPIAPALGLCLDADDMATWITFCLERGRVGETRVMPERAFNQTWISRVPISDGRSFAMGWLASFYEGKAVFSRGGSFGPFSAELAIMPGDDVGFAVMANTANDDLGEIFFALVADALFSDWDAASDLADADSAGISGAYRFDRMGVELLVTDQDGDVFLTIPGQGATILEAPGPDGARPLAANGAISVNFVRDEQGRVLGMHYRQQGREFFLPRQGFDEIESQPGAVGALSPEQVSSVLGVYRFDHYNGNIEIVRSESGLAMNVPWEGEHELVWLPGEDTWAFEDDIFTRVGFVGLDGPIVGAIEFVQGGAEHTLVRVPSVPGPGLPTIDDLMALRLGSLGSSLWQNAHNMRIKGEVAYENQGVEGSATALLVGEDSFRLDVNLGRFGRYSSGIQGDQAWTASSAQGYRQLEGAALAQARLQHPTVAFQDLRDAFLAVEVVGKTEYNWQEAYLVRAVPRQGPVITLTLSAQTGATLKMEGFTFDLTNGATPVATIFEDYREVFGVRMPFRIIDESPAFGRAVTQYEDIRLNVSVDDSTFAYVPTE